MQLTKKRLFSEFFERDFAVIRLRGLQLTIPRQFIPHFVYRDYEPVTTDSFLAAIEKASTVVDVGAHIGYFSCLAALATGPLGTVHAVEPCQANVEVLRRNLHLNRIRNVVVHEVAAAGTREWRTLQVTHSSDSHGFYEHPLANTLKTIEVEATPVDSLVMQRAAVIKIDVEGAEIEVLSGMVQLLERSSGAIVIVEWNPACLRSARQDPMELPRLLRRLGIGDILVLDDRASKTRQLGEVEEDVARGRTSVGWYVNLRGRVS